MLHYTVRPLLGWRAPIDFMLIAALFGAVRMRPGVAVMYGLALGLVSDALSVSGFGAAALGMTIVAYAASWLKAVFFADNLALNAFFLFVGKWVFDIVVVRRRAASRALNSRCRSSSGRRSRRPSRQSRAPSCSRGACGPSWSFHPPHELSPE